MTLAQMAVDSAVSEFGEEVTIVKGDSVESGSSDVFFYEDDNPDVEQITKKVRLYQTITDEQMQEYGFDDSTESIMYHDEQICDEGDLVKYGPMDKEWRVDSITTNQLGNGPYIYVFGMKST